MAKDQVFKSNVRADRSDVEVRTAEGETWQIQVWRRESGVHVELIADGMSVNPDRDPLRGHAAAAFGLQLLAAAGYPITATSLPYDLGNLGADLIRETRRAGDTREEGEG